MKLIDTCPNCEGELIAVCNVIIEYVIENEDDVQNWSRIEVDDDTSTPVYIKCEDCGSEWWEGEFELNEDGYLIGLGR